MQQIVPGDQAQLLFCFLLTVGFQLFFFALAAIGKVDTFTDLAGSTNFVLVALLTFSLGQMGLRSLIITVCVTLWGLRLAAYLFYRILKIGEDHRFDETRNDCCKFLGFWVFQMMWVWTVSLPVMFVNGSKGQGSDIEGDFLWSDAVGIVLFAVGLVCEAMADQQKFGFKRDPANKGKWCTVGIWQYSRHPNYFGEITLWWGVFTIGAGAFDSSHYNWGVATLASPAFVMAILLFLSGVPLLEHSADKRYGQQEEYRIYKARTSILVPLPNQLYAGLGEGIKTWLCCEWPMYTLQEEDYHVSGQGPDQDSQQSQQKQQQSTAPSAAGTDGDAVETQPSGEETA